MPIFKKCTDHLDTVGETYTQHMGFALYIGGTLILAGVLAILHALCPAIFQKNASAVVFRLNDEIRARMAQCPKSKQHE